MRLHAILTAASLFSSATAGINCKGNHGCGGPWASMLTDDLSNLHHSEMLMKLIDLLPDDIWIANDDLIGCTRSICAFVHDTEYGGMVAQDVKDLAYKIVDHGCKRCGSVPIHYPDSNHSEDGELTFNFKESACHIHGLCSPYSEVALSGWNRTYEADTISARRKKAKLEAKKEESEGK